MKKTTQVWKIKLLAGCSFLVVGIFVTLFILTNQSRIELVREVKASSKASYIQGYLTGAYQSIQDDSLVLVFARTYDVSPTQQEALIVILDMSRAVNQQIDMFFPEIKELR